MSSPGTSKGYFGVASRKVQEWCMGVLRSSSGTDAQFDRPKLSTTKESSVKGLYVIGDLAGAPVIKLAMQDGYNVINEISQKPNAKLNRETEGIFDVIVIGAGAAGLNAALAAQEKDLSVLVLEKGKVANTIENFPEGKWVYAEPDSVPPKGKLWLDGSSKEDLVSRWKQIVDENRLEVRTEEELVSLEKQSDGLFELQSSKRSYRCGYMVLATGQRGNPRKLDVPGEEQEKVYHRLYSPTKYAGEHIVVVGGGNSAIEAAVTLSAKNKVVLSYRRGEFERVFSDNLRKLEQAKREGNLTVLFNSKIKEFGEGKAVLEVQDGGKPGVRDIPFEHAFVLIGADLPTGFLKKIGVQLENEWSGSFWCAAINTFLVTLGLSYFGGSVSSFSGSLGLMSAIVFSLVLCVTAKRGNRFSYLGISFLIWFLIYGAKVGSGQEFWPFRGWGYSALSFFDRPWAFWYTVLYTALMTIFGIAALKRWGLDRGDQFQIWRYVSLLFFQWILFFIVPEYLFQVAVDNQWVGEKLANDPTFADQAWRSYGLIYAWPLFFYTFFYDPHQVWVVWGVLLSFVIIPILVLFHGKRYCSWICGCGGLAETFGDRWRHLAPKGKKSIAWEHMGAVVLVLATVVTLGMLFRDIYGFLKEPSDYGMWVYRVLVDVWLVGIIPVTLYPFFGGKVWCRYWCPLAKMMQYFSAFFSKFKVSRFSIEANDKCIACGECSRYCQVGIDVMSYALKQQTLDNLTSSCIGCGICVTVCPMDTLFFGNGAKGRGRLNVVNQ